jgi:hypothetical protein
MATTRKLVLGRAALLSIIAAPGLAQPSSTDAAQAYAQANARYQAEVDEYNRKQQTYDDQRRDYNAKLEAYERAVGGSSGGPDAVIVVEDQDPDVVIVDRGSNSAVAVDPTPDRVIVAREVDDFSRRLLMREVPAPLVRLEAIPNVNNDLFNAPVLDAMGLPVGNFRRIEVKAPGDVVAVVTLKNSRRTISLLTEHVRLDPDTGVIIADLTARQIDLIPSGFPYG